MGCGWLRTWRTRCRSWRGRDWMGARRCIERRSECGCGASEDMVDVRVTARREFAAKDTDARRYAAGAQYLSKALLSSPAIASADRPSMSCRSNMCTSWPSLKSAIWGDEGG